MSKQIGFYAVEEDHQFLLKLAEQADLCAIPKKSLVNTTVIPVSPTQFQVLDEEDSFYLLPKALTIGDVLYSPMPTTPSYQILLARVSPVIQFNICSKQNNKVYNGRFYLNLEQNDANYSLLEEKYKSLERQIRKWARTDQFRFYVGPQTIKLVLTGEVHLMHHLVELKVIQHE